VNSPPNTNHQQILLLNSNPNPQLAGIVKANPNFINSVNISTKLQQQVLMNPDASKQAQ
jgi:hypothetical protein